MTHGHRSPILYARSKLMLVGAVKLRRLADGKLHAGQLFSEEEEVRIWSLRVETSRYIGLGIREFDRTFCPWINWQLP